MNDLDKEILVIYELLAMNRAQRRERGIRQSKTELEDRCALLEGARLTEEEKCARTEQTVGRVAEPTKEARHAETYHPDRTDRAATGALDRSGLS